METYLKTHGAVKEIHTQTARDSRERWENVGPGLSYDYGGDYKP